MMEPLHSERLTIRNFQPDDSRDLFEYLSRADVLTYEPGTPENRTSCDHLAAERARGDNFLAVCLKDPKLPPGQGDHNEAGKMIGHLYLERQDPLEFNTWEIGYIFNPVFGKQGFATEAARCLVAWLFEGMGAHRVIALCNPENISSWHLLERIGMRREGHFLKKAFFKRDSSGNPLWHDAYEYAILREEFMNGERH